MFSKNSAPSNDAHKLAALDVLEAKVMIADAGYNIMGV